MLDRLGRSVQYLRVSVTDRCNLRCQYCVPECGIAPLGDDAILTNEEILRLCRVFAALGGRKIRLTGGEPLLRSELPALVAGLAAIPGIGEVALTTNGVLLESSLPELADAGLSAINLSLNAATAAVYQAVTRCDHFKRVLRALDAAVAEPRVHVKLNCVPTCQNRGELAPLVLLATERGVPLRFIELMPIGEGVRLSGLCEEEVMAELRAAFGALTPADSCDRHEKCREFTLSNGARIGFISALTHRFCETCDRVRLTADGFLKTCLQYDAGVALRPLLSEDDPTLFAAMARAIFEKPEGHHFGGDSAPGDEVRGMSQIGG